MTSMNHLQFSVIVFVQLVLTCVFLYSLPVVCQDSYGTQNGVRQRRSAQGSGGAAATCECGTEPATLTCSEEPTDCDEDEVFYGGSCYRFIRDDLKSRDNAHRDCIARNSHLVYIESKEEQAFLATRAESLIGDSIRYFSQNNYWIGLIPTPNNVWLDGKQANNDMFKFSAESAPGCFSMNKFNGDLLLNGENCDTERFYICELPQECNWGEMFSRGGSCYLLVDYLTSYLHAKDGCSSYGGHLLYIESQDELQFINSNVSQDDSQYWIGLTTQYAWLDGSRAIYLGFPQKNYRNDEGSLCFRFWPNDGFLWADSGCGYTDAFICEREIPVISSQERPGVSCRPPVANLNRLLDSVPLCVRSGRKNNYVLCQCGDDETCIKGCGCARDNTIAGLETIRCSCGFCSFTFDESGDENVGRTWSSDFRCKCSVNGTSSNVTIVNGEFTCVADDAESTTISGDIQPTTSATTSTPKTVRQTDIGIPVGVTLASLIILVALIVGFVWWKRHHRGNAPRVDSPQPDEADTGSYENPRRMATRLNPFAATYNLPVGKGLSLGSDNKSSPNPSNHEPPLEHDMVYENQMVFPKRRLGKDQPAPKRSDAGTKCPPSYRTQQPLRAVIPTKV